MAKQKWRKKMRSQKQVEKYSSMRDIFLERQTNTVAGLLELSMGMNELPKTADGVFYANAPACAHALDPSEEE